MVSGGNKESWIWREREREKFDVKYAKVMDNGEYRGIGKEEEEEVRNGEWNNEWERELS